MIEIQIVDGINSPMLFCDVCGERIEDAGKAAVVFDNFRQNGERAKTLHVHKGSIGGKTCHHEAELIIRSGGGTPGWQELKRHLCDLAHNVAFPASVMAEYDK
ncbi:MULTISPECIES: hypothetical protein [Pseudomonas]|uniref:Uncharacterized protein n=1 Tax=Pseudomonas wuhanensis TaxID=2954098 RepID=A0ABY9GVF0_9PSED|nr:MULTISPECIES: hypothetical protein [unclassified Pseudomonas]WLI13888.1 hypothetical protein PSH65_07040 [Pseudomonas sp. FP603]WLI19786.1 hypothetical protein PSH88_07045 [Pseudomonas sp. FP607]